MGNKPTVVARDRSHLKSLIEEAIATNGPKCDLNFIDVSKVDDMGELFKDSQFDGDISKWNVSSVKDMCGMFRRSAFDGDPRPRPFVEYRGFASFAKIPAHYRCDKPF